MGWFTDQRAKRQAAMSPTAAPIPPNMGIAPPVAPTAPQPDLMQSLDGANSAPPPGSVAPQTGLPAGYSLNPTTGMGGYTLASYSAPGLAAPNVNSFSGVDANSIANSPAYQFRMQQGQEAIERSAAAKGTLLTGGTLKDLTAFGQGLASTEYDKQFDRDLGLYDRANNLFDTNARRTYDMLSGISSFGMRAADGQSGAFTNAGNARANATLGSADAINQGAGAVAGTLAEYFARRRAQNPNTTANYSLGGG